MDVPASETSEPERFVSYLHHTQGPRKEELKSEPGKVATKIHFTAALTDRCALEKLKIQFFIAVPRAEGQKKSSPNTYTHLHTGTQTYTYTHTEDSIRIVGRDLQQHIWRLGMERMEATDKEKWNRWVRDRKWKLIFNALPVSSALSISSVPPGECISVKWLSFEMGKLRAAAAAACAGTAANAARHNGGREPGQQQTETAESFQVMCLAGLRMSK